MQMDECIKSRRSVRKYIDREITKEELHEIVSLARFSPSWKNTQVIRYHAVKNPQLKETLAQNCMMGFEYNQKTVLRCNTLVVVSAVGGICGYESDGSWSTAKQDRWEMFDAGIASQTFCLAAHSKGIGSVILGIFDEEKIHNFLHLPQEEKVMNLIALGYPLEEGKTAPARKRTEQILEIIE